MPGACAMSLSLSSLPSRHVHFFHLVGWLVVARLIFVGAGLYAGTVFPAATQPNSEYVAIPWPSAAELLVIVRNLHRSADEGWYFSVADQGYATRPFDLSRQENWSMSPLLPIVWKLVGLDFRLLILLIYVANVCALYFLWRICLDVLNLGVDKSQLVCLVFIFWPSGYQLFCTRPEPLLVTLTFVALYYYWKGVSWRGFGVVLVCVFLATAAKPNGFMTGAALVGTECLTQLRDRRWGWLSLALWLRLILLFLATFAPLVFLSIIMYVKTGNPLAWIDIQATWSFPPRASIESVISAFFPPAMVGLWGWSPMILNSALLYFSLAVLVYFAIKKWNDKLYWPLLIQSALIQLLSGALFYANAFNRHSLPIVLNYLAAGNSRKSAFIWISVGAGIQALAGALAALHVIYIMA